MSSLAQALIAYAQSGGKDSSTLMRALAQPRSRPSPAMQSGRQPMAGGASSGGGSDSGPNYPMQKAGDMTILPTTWKGTHVTDGLGWGAKSAEDIFPGGPGTPVGAPEPGTVEYFHPTGAQGGGSMMFRADSGRTYWIGHIQGGARAGSRLKRGQYIAQVADQNVSVPHVHIDRR